MIKYIVPLALPLAAFFATVAIAQDTGASPDLTLQQKTALRCSAAFAIVAERQANGDEQAASYPAMAQRGREFFVRSSAQLMDQTGMSRDQVAGLLYVEAQDLEKGDGIERIMPSCLLLLDASGL